MISTTLPGVTRPEPRWPVILAVFAAVALHFALPPALRVNPPWLLATVVVVLVAAAQYARYRNMPTANSVLGFSVLGVLTLGLLWGVGRLLFALIAHQGAAAGILQGAAVLWVTNVIVFASLYWRLDAGGPNARERRAAHTKGAFLFPQMTLTAPNDERTVAEAEGWRPHFVDYLFVAFNTSTAFSPTDAPVLSKWAKLAMMFQAMISFTTVVLVAARAVNIL
jgi:hypothetical protein